MEVMLMHIGSKKYDKLYNKGKFCGEKISNLIKKEHLALTIPRKRFFVNLFKRKKVQSTLEKSLKEIKNYKFSDKDYNEFFKVMLDKEINYTQDELEILFDGYVDAIPLFELNTRTDEDIINYGDFFKDILDAEHFDRLYVTIKDCVKKKIDETKRKISDPIELKYELLREKSPYINCLRNLAIIRYNKINETGKSEQEFRELYQIFKNDFNDFYCKYSLFDFYKDDNNFEALVNLLTNGKELEGCLNFYDKVVNEQRLDDSCNIDRTAQEIIQSVMKNKSWTTQEIENLFQCCKDKKNFAVFPFMAFDEQTLEKIQNTEVFQKYINDNKVEYIFCLQNKSRLDLYLSEKERYTDTDLKVNAMIIDELAQRQGKKYTDLKEVGYGLTSNVYEIGDYIVKLGNTRLKKNIPNHRRILQPIIREKINKLFIEVCDKVILGKATEEKVKKVFDEMLNDGIAWMDPKPENLGMLVRSNIPRHNIQKKVNGEYVDDTSSSSEIATNMSGDVSGPALDKGEFVIIDTDLIYDLKKLEDRKCFYEGKGKIQSYMTQEMREAVAEKLAEYGKDDFINKSDENSKEDDDGYTIRMMNDGVGTERKINIL